MANQGDEISSNAGPPNQNNTPLQQEASPARRTQGPPTARLPAMQIDRSQLAARHPPPPPLPPTQSMIAMTAHLPHKCPVCSYGFHHKSSLGGHMMVHRDRSWRGLIPPSDLSQSVSSSGVGVGSSSGGLQAGSSQSALVPSLPTSSLRKQPSPPDEQTSPVAKRFKKMQDGNYLPDLNDFPPSHDDQEGEGEDGAGGTTAA